MIMKPFKRKINSFEGLQVALFVYVAEEVSRIPLGDEFKKVIGPNFFSFVGRERNTMGDIDGLAHRDMYFLSRGPILLTSPAGR